MESFKKEDFEKLSLIREKICVSIFIPTHEAGMEINEGMDKTSFKNEIQKIKNELEKRNLQDKYIAEFLKPAYTLLEDTGFWRIQSKGLAAFIKENTFLFYRLPIAFEEFSVISASFELTPLIPLLVENDIFYSLALSHNKIRLFRNTAFTYEEMNISGSIPENAKEVLSVYDFEAEEKEKNVIREGLRRTPGQGPLPSHSGSPQDSEYIYVTEFLRKVNKGVTEVLKHEKAPLVVAAVNNVFALYKQVNTYKNIMEEGVLGNPDHVKERDFHQMSYKIVKNILNKPRRKNIEKYSAWSGTGKTSYDLETILNAAYDGKIESLFILEKAHIWGDYNEKERKIIIHETKQGDDICLLSLLSAKTIENKGEAFLITRQEMNEIQSETYAAAIFRY